jgi:hypothetical protein
LIDGLEYDPCNQHAELRNLSLSKRGVVVVGWVTYRFKRRIDPWILILIMCGVGAAIGAGIGAGFGGAAGAVIGAIIGAIIGFIMWLSDVLTGNNSD